MQQFSFMNERPARCKSLLSNGKNFKLMLSLLIGRMVFLTREKSDTQLLIGRIVFLTREKSDTRLLIGRIIFLTREMTIRGLWLAKSNERTKIYCMEIW